ncbi:XRE family transcriptional regulator [Marinobacter sp. NSM]|uniref:XRE family transcriptional regulator n=1 Tax=Marinobacter sp. NSM TaxID=3458004 RepID=UPI0040354A2C
MLDEGLYVHEGYDIYHSVSSQVDLDTKSVVARMDTLRTIRIMENWQDRVRSVMREKGVTQDRLTSVLGVSTRGAVGHYLSGRREPSASQLKALAEFLDVDIDWLLTGEGPKKKNFDIFATAIKVFAKKHRRPGDENLTDQEVYDRYEAEEEAKERAIQDQLDIQSGRFEDAAALEEPDELGLTEVREPSVAYLRRNELEFFGHMDAWDSNTPLDEDEVELPLFREVELAAGGGATQVIENHGAKLRFAKSTLRRAGVPAESAACAFVRGNSMEPVMPDGTCVGVNTADKAIKDGEIYAIDHGGMLRVKYLHRRPGGGIKIVSQNASEHPVEEVTAEEMASNVRVIGRVFWWSVLR